MASFSVGPGDDIDAWCGKCLMVMNHRIIAVVGSHVKKVECLTCHAIHAYKSALGEKAKTRVPRATSGAASSPRSPKPVTPRPSRLENEWKTFIAEMPEGHEPRRYKVSESYVVSEFIEHPSFGTGRVLEITGAEKMIVIFRDGRKTLLCNRTKHNN